MNTILQVPVNKNLRDKAASKVAKMGFSSLQEVIRLFLNKVAEGEISITFEETVKLSSKAINRYNKMIEEVESGKIKTKNFTDVTSLMKHLNEN